MGEIKELNELLILKDLLANEFKLINKTLFKTQLMDLKSGT